MTRCARKSNRSSRNDVRALRTLAPGTRLSTARTSLQVAWISARDRGIGVAWQGSRRLSTGEAVFINTSEKTTKGLNVIAGTRAIVPPIEVLASSNGPTSTKKLSRVAVR